MDRSASFKLFLRFKGNCLSCLSFVSALICFLGDARGTIAEMPSAATNNPAIEFTFVPPYGSSEDLIGRVRNVNPNDFKVAVYIFVEGAGWWTKPSFNQPLLSIAADSTWIADVTTGGSDINATQIRAFLLPNGVNPIISAGLGCLPPSLDAISVAHAFIERNPRTIFFSGYEWSTKASFEPVGPGPCIFANDSANVWLDNEDRLHVKISNRNGIWNCSEVILKNSLGYGTYVFKVIGALWQINENAVLGLFTWDNEACDEFNREVDIEFSRFGFAQAANAQYVIQPYQVAGNLFTWDFPASPKASTHVLKWTPDSIAFWSAKGLKYPAANDSLIQPWVYKSANMPKPDNAHIRINFWLFNGRPPSDSQELEIVIAGFEYYELPTAVEERRAEGFDSYALFQNYPNPFNPSTTIRFEVPRRSHVSITIYDLHGHEVRKLVVGEFGAGSFEAVWDGRNHSGKIVASGVYLIRMQADQFVSVKKLMLIR